MKKKISIALFGLVGSLLLMGNLVQAQIKAGDAAKMAEAAVGIYVKVKDSCSKKTAEDLMVCKGEDCVPGKCISFRTRCKTGCG
jgi:ubiquitin